MKSTFEIEATIKALNKKKNELELVLESSKQKLFTLKHQKDQEEADVKRLEEESFLTTLLKLIHLYNGQLSKETEEFLRVKLEYDRQEAECTTIKRHLRSLEARIFDEELQLKDLSKELEDKRQRIEWMQAMAPQKVLYDKMTVKHEVLKQQGVEIQEAIMALDNVIQSIQSTKKILESADQWATLDVLGGGIFTDVVKYSKIDAAKSEMEQLSAFLKCLNRELADVTSMPALALSEISQMTQLYDTWFDNFFTDLKVKKLIGSQIETIIQLEDKMKLIEGQLKLKRDANSSNIHATLESLEHILLEIEAE